MRKQPEIKVVAYVHVGDQLVNVDELDKERRVKLATWLKPTYLNELFRGEPLYQVHFWPLTEE